MRRGPMTIAVVLGLGAGCVPPPAAPPRTGPAPPTAPATTPATAEVPVTEPVAPPIDPSLLEDGAPPPDLTAHPPCIEVTELRDVTDPVWGPVLRDLARHIRHDGPWHDNLVTAAHESTHLMNTQIVEQESPRASGKINGFYLLGDCGVVIAEPSLRKSDAIAYIPVELRGLRFAPYLPADAGWDAVPTYLLDEWIAYSNGSAAAHELLASGNWTGRHDAMAGQVEFTIYALALGMAVRDLDPSYFADGVTFKQLLAWNAQRSLDQYRAGRAEAVWPSEEQDRLYEALRSDPVGEPMRAFIRDTWGADHLARLLAL